MTYQLLDTKTGNIVGRYETLEEARARRKDFEDPDLRVIWWTDDGQNNYGSHVLHVDAETWSERLDAFFAVLRRNA